MPVGRVHGLADLRLAQNRDAHLLAIKRLMKNETLPESLCPQDVRKFARKYFQQKKALLFMNQDDIFAFVTRYSNAPYTLDLA